MMVIFTSQSDKKALKTTRWILDAFADRIGKDTWQTIITQEGLEQVKSLLRRHATKSMSVSCRWIRSRHRSELLWIIGDKSRFNEEGIVPVNYTQKDIMHQHWENNWAYLPAIKALAAVAGLLHDWGKCNDAFQQKLKAHKNEGDAFRHEWLSCRLIVGLVHMAGKNDDEAWLNLLAENKFSAEELSHIVNAEIKDHLIDLPPIASMLCWLILSHHRLPVINDKEKVKGYENTEVKSFADVFAYIQADWGYQNQTEDIMVRFSQGLLQNSSLWQKQLQKWLGRLILEKDTLLKIWQSEDIRLFLLLSRLCLMLADYSVSASEAEADWQGQNILYANTYKGELKQKLDEHLVRVGRQAARIAHYLPAFTEEMARAENVRALRKKSPRKFAWQDKAVAVIHKYREKLDAEQNRDNAYFIVNMASTGCGKTFANAKIMQAVSENEKSLRYILCLGLRSLTLQTGDEYRQRLGLTKDDMAVLIGSAAVRQLHEEDNVEEDTANMEDLLSGEIDSTFFGEQNFLDIFFNGQKNKMAKKNKALLYQPVVVATIDHLMPATETIKGGRYMLPLLRMLSSDLVIDEIDDFSKRDLIAIARLVHLAGMLGRNVLLSSATIPPDLAEGLFSAYQAGRELYAKFFQRQVKFACVWCDEARTQLATIAGKATEEMLSSYREEHAKFAMARVAFLQSQIVQRKGTIVDCMLAKRAALAQQDEMYFRAIREMAEQMHQLHAVVDKKTGKNFSLGLVRMANINPCVAVGKYLLHAEWSENVTVRIMVYHSQQTLLLRHEQEHYLDQVLKRKDEHTNVVEIKDKTLRHHLDTAKEDNIIFIVVATPVEEIGRDHDFDWAIMEPSSYRSIIQLSGRVLRHRQQKVDVEMPNVAVMQFNLNGLHEKRLGFAFCKPGFESRKYPLKTHDMKKLVDTKLLAERIDASLRVSKPLKLQAKSNLSDLEHKVMQDFRDLSQKGPANLHGWQAESWYLTGIPQKLNPFREGSQSLSLYLCPVDDKMEFQELNVHTKEYVKRTDFYGIHIEADEISERFWLERNYQQAIKERVLMENTELEGMERLITRTCHRYGELSLPIYGDSLAKGYNYSDEYGLYRDL